MTRSCVKPPVASLVIRRLDRFGFSRFMIWFVLFFSIALTFVRKPVGAFLVAENLSVSYRVGKQSSCTLSN